MSLIDADNWVTVRVDDLRALLDAVDIDYVIAENLSDLEERVERLATAVGEPG